MVESTQFDKVDVVKASGRIDSHTAPELKKAFDGLIEQKRYSLVFDMSDIDFLSSSGVWVLLETQKRCRRRKRGDLVIASANDNIQKTLDLAGLMHFMKMYEDVDAAVGSF